MASGRNPSKLTINTRLTFGAGVEVTVDGSVTVGGGSGVPGTRVCVGSGAIVGVESGANDPQLVKSDTSKVKSNIFLAILKL